MIPKPIRESPETVDQRMSALVVGNTRLTHQDRRPASRRATHVWWWLVALAAGGKLYCALTTFGSNDVVSFCNFGRTLNEVGLAETYRIQPLFNHPPLVGWYLQAICRLTGPSFEWFPFWLRLPGILADVGTGGLVITAARRAESPCAPWACAVYLLSPVSFMVAGFHGNTDPVVVFFLFAAAFCSQVGRPRWGALCFALSLQVKVVGLVVLPIYGWCWLRQGRIWSNLGIVCLVCLVGWWQPLTQAPGLFVSHVLGYGSYWGVWGITYWLRLTGLKAFDATRAIYLNRWCVLVVSLLKLSIVGATTWVGWRVRRRLPQDLIRTLAFGWGIFFVLSPGASVQYLVWLAPFVLWCDGRWYLVLTAGSSVFLFVFYALASRGFPWYYANASDLKAVSFDYAWGLWAWAACGYGLALLPRFLQTSALPPQNAGSNPA